MWWVRNASAVLIAAACVCLLPGGDRGAADAQTTCGKITACPPASLPLSGGELAVIVQSGQDKKVAVGNLGAPSPVISVLTFGAVCDGSHNDSAAFTAALNAAGNAGGGNVYVPPTGHACYLAQGITLPSNVQLSGAALHHWFGPNVSDPAQWAAAGSWIQCGDTINPCITINSVGNLVNDINVIYSQPTPGSSWTPTIYPYTFAINGSANFWGLRDVSITAATHCIDIEGPDSGVGGINSFMQDIYFNGCFNVGTRFSKIDNEIRVSNLNYYPWWFVGTASVEAYISAHKIDWDSQYLANIQGNNIVFGRSYRSIQLRNGTVNSGFGSVTFAGNDWQLNNVSFNEVCQAVSIPDGNGTITSQVSLTNVIAYGNTSTNCPASSPIMFDLSSDQANWSISHVEGGDVDTLVAIGHGAAGTLKLNDVDVAAYSFFTPARDALMISENASVTLSGSPMNGIRPAGGAGNVVGPGVDATQGYLQPTQGGGGGVEGYALLEGSHDATSAGDVGFYAPDGTRRGFIGRGSSAGEMNIQSDTGTINLQPVGAANQLSVGSAAGVLEVDLSGIASDTQVACLGLNASNKIVFSAGACAASGAAVSVTAATPDLVITPSPGTGTFTVGSTQPLNDQSGGDYAIVTGDGSKTILAGVHTYTLPQAGTAGFASGWGFCILNLGAGNATLTTTTSTFLGAGGGTSITLAQNQWACPTSNGTDYDTFVGAAGAVTVSNSDGTLTISPTSGAVVASIALGHANTWSGAQTFGEVIGTVSTQSGTTYTLAATDCGTTVLFTNGSAITVTTLNSLPVGCSIAIEQGGAGQITIANGSGATSHSAHSYTKTFGQYAILGLFVDTNSGGSAADIIITGDGA